MTGYITSEQPHKDSSTIHQPLPTPTPAPVRLGNPDQKGAPGQNEYMPLQDLQKRREMARFVLKKIVGIDLEKGHTNKEVTDMLKEIEIIYDDSKSSLEKSAAIVKTASILQSSLNKITENTTLNSHKLVQYYKDLLPGGEKFASALVTSLDPEKSELEKMEAALDLAHTGGEVFERISKGKFQYKGFLSRPLTLVKAANTVLDEEKSISERAYAMAELAAEGVTSYEDFNDLFRVMKKRRWYELVVKVRVSAESYFSGLVIAKKFKAFVVPQSLKKLVGFVNLHKGAGSEAVASLLTSFVDDSKRLDSLTSVIAKVRDPVKQKELLTFFGKAPKRTLKAITDSEMAMAGIVRLFRNAERTSVKDFSKAADLIGAKNLQRFAEFAYLAEGSSAELLLVTTKQFPTLAPIINAVFGSIEKMGLRMTPKVAQALTVGFQKAIPGLGAGMAAIDVARYGSIYWSAKNFEQAVIAFTATATNTADVVSSLTSMLGLKGALTAGPPDAALAFVNLYLALHNEYIDQSIEAGTYKPPVARLYLYLETGITSLTRPSTFFSNPMFQKFSKIT